MTAKSSNTASEGNQYSPKVSYIYYTELFIKFMHKNESTHYCHKFLLCILINCDIYMTKLPYLRKKHPLLRMFIH